MKTTDRFFLIKISLILIVLFSFSSVVRATDYELLIITPAKYENIADSFLQLHNGDGVYTVYAIVEEIDGAYGHAGEDQPAAAAAPGVPTPSADEMPGDEAYANELSRKIIKFLRGVLGFDSEQDEENGVIPSDYARNLLYTSLGVQPGYLNVKYYETEKISYLLLLGDTGAGGRENVTSNGVPESWYIYMDPDDYPDEYAPDGSIFPTDFFYANPDYDEDEWIPNLRVGRLPIHDLDAALDNGNVIDVNGVAAEEDRINGFSVLLDECDICDSSQNWDGGDNIVGSATPGEWAGDDTDTPCYELVITSDGDGEGDAPIGATYLILDNTDTCLRVLGDPEGDGVEGETGEGVGDGDGYEIRDSTDEATDVYNKCNNYYTAVTTAGAWNTWFRKAVVVGGDPFSTTFAFWGEFNNAFNINAGYFEGCEITKLQHTNKDDADATNDFNEASLSPYLNDTDCGLLYEVGHGSGSAWALDGGSITATEILGYVAGDYHIPIVVSIACINGEFDRDIGNTSLGEAVVLAPTGGGSAGGIAYIGGTDTNYSGVGPYFDDGVLKQDRLMYMGEMLSNTLEYFHSNPTYIGDMFMGPSTEASGGPIIDFIQNNTMDYWVNQKTIWEYILLGDPALPIPYPEDTTINLGTEKPVLHFNNNTLRNRTPQYESHDIPVDEIPTGGSASTTLNISAGDSPDKLKITRIDVRRDEGKHYHDPGNAPSTYSFDTADTEPSYYLVKVEQQGWDGTESGVGDWGNWWAKENWIYVQEVNRFVSSTNNILVVDDDFGYPFVTETYMMADESDTDSIYVDGYEDWYLNALDELGEAYDVWHVDFDDTDLFNVHFPGAGDDWADSDLGDAVMHGEVYSGLLDNYNYVVWLTGNPNGLWHETTDFIDHWVIETLTSHEQTRLGNYLDDSGRLFLSGQGILWDLGCSGVTEDANLEVCMRTNSNIETDFLVDYLKVNDILASAGYGYHPQLDSVPGNPVIGDYGVIVAGGDGAQNQYIYNEVVQDTGIATEIFEYDYSVGAVVPYEQADPFWGTAATCHYQGIGGSIFFPWGFEAIDNQTDRNNVMDDILDWLDSPRLTGEEEEEPEEDVDGDDDGTGGDGGAGGGGVGSLSGGCFIATASYGTSMAEEVQVLCDFRDNYLLKNPIGKFFVYSYYRTSPKIASFISEHPSLKKFVRLCLKPVVETANVVVEE